MKPWAFLILGVFLLTGAPLEAHHYFVARYDGSKELLLKGVVTRIEWTNPHSHIDVDVKSAGAVVTWVCESGSPGTLDRQGLKRDDLKIGDIVAVDVFPARNGSHSGIIRRITLPNGRAIVMP